MIFHPEAFTFDYNDTTVVDYPIDYGCGQHWIPEHFSLFPVLLLFPFWNTLIA